MTLILWSLKPVLTFVGVQDHEVRLPHVRAKNKVSMTASDERPPPN